MTTQFLKAIRCLIIGACILTCAGSLSAQSVEFGVRFMPTVSSFKMKSSSGGTVGGEATLGYGIGALLGVKISDHVGIQVEAIYTSLYQKIKEQDEEQKINLRYFNIPLLLSLNTGKTKTVNLNVVAGPQLGISAGSSLKTTNNNNNNDQPILSVKKTDVGFAFGAGFDFGLDEAKKIRLGLGYRGVLGLIDISDRSDSDVSGSYYILEKTKVNTHSVYAGLSIMF